MIAKQYAEQELNNMTVGFTKVINGKAVTRWSDVRWEVGTYGKAIAVNVTEALVKLGL